MLMAVLGDIHGNLPALDAALEAIDDAGIQTILNAGDSVVGFPFPGEVVTRLRERGLPSAQSEADRQVALFHRKRETFRARLEAREFARLEWTHLHTPSDGLEYLRALPRRVDATIEGLDIGLCHGRPSNRKAVLREDDSEEEFRREREVANVHIVVCGGGHRPFARLVDEALFVNPGSLGVPRGDEPLGSFAVVNTEELPWQVEFRTIPFDADRIDQRLAEFDVPPP